MKKLIALLSIVSTFSYASCNDLYPGGKRIDVPGATELCNTFYVTVYDTKNKAALLVSEKLQPGSKFDVKRVDSFRSDDRLKNSPKNSDYKRSGYDRGHLAPADDAVTVEQMENTFLLTNMTPQEPSVNRVSWKKLEDLARKSASRANKPVYVVSIPTYGAPFKKIGSGIPVPTGYYKFILEGNTKTIYYVRNVENAKAFKVSGADIKAALSQNKF